ncbi:DUF2235 domain-containing protein [Bradyrhizobium sp. LeoA1S1]
MLGNDQDATAAPVRGSNERSATQATTIVPRPKRKLVLFADGTGNAFTKQESNVWRLYEALDRTRPDQVAHYIKGVGTAGWAPLAAIDGATGIGVPSNVRKLYRFLCWNWEPGDEIYIFGFSRGAFTARTLAALIASQGLVPAAIGGETVTHAEMQRNAMAAWREYRRKTVPWRKTLPTIWITRAVRDLALGIYHRIMRHRSYDDVRKAMDGRTNVEIEFLGLFDTVEAFGVPVEELRTAIDWAIWPISFRNRKLSDKVKLARHALSLDDERATFHPIRFDQSAPASAEQIREVWFSGVHSDVGGGYPDGTLSFVPLVWMVEQIEHRLRFQPGRIEHFRAYQSAIGPIHDSRSGAAVMYRYGPRPITETKADGGPPVIHFGVVERMLHGCDDYAPVTLPASAKVLTNGKAQPLTAPKTGEAMKSAYERTARAHNGQAKIAADAFETMPPPNAEIADQALDTVWWRRVAYFSLLGGLALLATWPWVARSTVGMLSKPFDAVSVGGTTPLAAIRWIDDGVGAVVGSTAKLLSGFLPSYVAPWLNIAIYYPFATTVLVLLVLAAWHWNASLRDRIQERARLAWDHPNRAVPNVGKASPLLKIGRFMRLHAGPVRTLFTKGIFPGMFLLIIFSIALLAVGRSYFNWRVGTGGLCDGTAKPASVGEQVATASALFDISNPCWASGLRVEKGRRYRIWIKARDPWFDRTIMSGVTGFRYDEFRHLSALPIRRLYRADWLQPVARIGDEGSDDLPLQAINGVPADDLPRTSNAAEKRTLPIRLDEVLPFKDENNESGRTLAKLGTFEPIPQALLQAAHEVWRTQGLADLMVADFVAPESGELFLYVNDAVQVFPFLGPFNLFYGNNSGTAEVKLQRVPLPPPDK